MVDGLPVRKRKRIQVSDLRALRRAHDRARLIRNDDAAHAEQAMRPARSQAPAAVRSSASFALADHDHVGARRQILHDVVGALRPAEHYRPAHAASRPPRCRAPVAASSGWCRCPARRPDAARRRAVNSGLLPKVLSNTSTVNPARFEISRQREQPERRIRLHDLPLLLVVGKK